jgi:hypothetical protein
MWRFQCFEVILKQFWIDAYVSGPLQEIEANIEKRRKEIGTDTFGAVLSLFKKQVLTYDEEEPEIELKEEGDIGYSHSYKLKDDDGSLYKALDEVRKQRNEFVHHLLPRFGINLEENAEEVIQYLDRQNEEILPTYRMLCRLGIQMQEDMRASGRAINQYRNSDDHKKDLHFFHICERMQQIIDEKARADGWCSIAIAAQSLKQEFPDAVNMLKECTKCKTMKEALIALGFEVKEEATSKGGVRELCRNKPKS